MIQLAHRVSGSSLSSGCSARVPCVAAISAFRSFRVRRQHEPTPPVQSVPGLHTLAVLADHGRSRDRTGDLLLVRQAGSGEVRAGSPVFAGDPLSLPALPQPRFPPDWRRSRRIRALNGHRLRARNEDARGAEKQAAVERCIGKRLRGAGRRDSPKAATGPRLLQVGPGEVRLPLDRPAVRRAARPRNAELGGVPTEVKVPIGRPERRPRLTATAGRTLWADPRRCRLRGSGRCRPTAPSRCR